MGPRGAARGAAGRRAARGGLPRAVPVNATLGAEDRAGAAAQARAARAAGFACVKVKVGVGDDAGRLAAVRAAVGPDVAVRVDANGAWGSPAEALANLRALAPAGLELAEEPVHGVEALRAVRAESPVRVAMDETAAEPGAAGSGAVDAVCLKIARCGGISGVLRDAAAARAAGSEVYVASSFDGPLGVAAGVHAAAALAAGGGEVLHCGLATLGAFAGLEGVLPARAARSPCRRGRGCSAEAPRFAELGLRGAVAWPGRELRLGKEGEPGGRIGAALGERVSSSWTYAGLSRHSRADAPLSSTGVEFVDLMRGKVDTAGWIGPFSASACRVRGPMRGWVDRAGRNGRGCSAVAPRLR